MSDEGPLLEQDVVRPERGLGLLLIRELIDNVQIERDERGTTLLVCKCLRESEQLGRSTSSQPQRPQFISSSEWEARVIAQVAPV